MACPPLSPQNMVASSGVGKVTWRMARTAWARAARVRVVGRDEGVRRCWRKRLSARNSTCVLSLLLRQEGR